MIHFLRTHGTLGFVFFVYLFVTTAAENLVSFILSVATFFFAVEKSLDAAKGAGSAWRPGRAQKRWLHFMILPFALPSAYLLSDSQSNWFYAVSATTCFIALLLALTSHHRAVPTFFRTAGVQDWTLSRRLSKRAVRTGAAIGACLILEALAVVTPAEQQMNIGSFHDLTELSRTARILVPAVTLAMWMGLDEPTHHWRGRRGLRTNVIRDALVCFFIVAGVECIAQAVTTLGHDSITASNVLVVTLSSAWPGLLTLAMACCLRLPNRKQGVALTAYLYFVLSVLTVVTTKAELGTTVVTLLGWATIGVTTLAIASIAVGCALYFWSSTKTGGESLYIFTR